MNKGLIAKTHVIIQAPVEDVWEALIRPELIKKYMFGSDVVSDFTVGSSIVWKGEWEGKPYEDKGEVLRVEENRVLEFSHFSPMMGKPDSPENYHTVTIELSGDIDETQVSLTQDGNSTEEEKNHSEANWRVMLEELKKLLEHQK